MGPFSQAQTEPTDCRLLTDHVTKHSRLSMRYFLKTTWFCLMWTFCLNIYETRQIYCCNLWLSPTPKNWWTSFRSTRWCHHTSMKASKRNHTSTKSLRWVLPLKWNCLIKDINYWLPKSLIYVGKGQKRRLDQNDLLPCWLITTGYVIRPS